MAEPFSTVRLADFARMDRTPTLAEFEQFMVEFHQFSTAEYNGGKGVPIETSKQLARKEMSILDHRGARTILDKYKHYTPGTLPPWPILLWSNGSLDTTGGSEGVFHALTLAADSLPREAVTAFKAARRVAMAHRKEEAARIKAEKEAAKQSRASKKSAERTAGIREGRLGECAVCGRTQKVSSSGLIAHHGYTRPQGWGFQETCVGSREDHYGKSVKACHKYVRILDRGEQAARTRLEGLKKAETIEVPKRGAWKSRETVTMGKDSPRFETERNRLIAEVERNLVAIAADRELMYQRIKSWQSFDPKKVLESSFMTGALAVARGADLYSVVETLVNSSRSRQSPRKLF
jgi:hypothetical protein